MNHDQPLSTAAMPVPPLATSPTDAPRDGAGDPAVVPVPSSASAPSPGIAAAASAAHPRPRRGWIVMGLVALVLAAGGVAWAALGHLTGLHVSDSLGALHEVEESEEPAATMSVNTIRPRRKLLEKVLVQPGSLEADAQAELFAKVSGSLRHVGRDMTPALAAGLLARQGAAATTLGGPAAAIYLAAAARLDLAHAPQKDIGSHVRAGELLMEIDAPERAQEIVEKQALLQQRQAELAQATASIAAFEAAIEAAKASKLQAEADVRRYQAEHAFRGKELGRLRDLAKSNTITAELADEKEQHVSAARAAWDSGIAKVQAAQAELSVVSSKFAAAKADLKVKEALVRVAREEVRRAEILAGFNRVVAPFDGIITYRGVDEGDFIQNSSSGQTRSLMTVTSIGRVKAVLQVPAREAVLVRLGAEATVEVDTRADWKVKGRVARIGHIIDLHTRTMQVEIDFDNPEHTLLPGMYGQVTLTLQQLPDAQAIPATAVYSRKGINYLLEVRDGIVQRQPVRIRFDDGKELEVVKLINGQEVPLDGSEEVVISNKGEIADGQLVSAKCVEE